MKPKLLALVGPTASGKSACAVRLAEIFDGEIVSADSRQIYRGVDIGTGKITEEEKRGVPHHLLDIAELGDPFSVVDFKIRAEEAIDDIVERDKLPILAGGTGQYIQAVVDNITPPHVPADEELRTELAACSLEELQGKLQVLDPVRLQTIDTDNPRRLIRAIEIATHIGKVPPVSEEPSRYDVLQVGLLPLRDELRDRIRKRTEERLQEGWVDEITHLLEQGVQKKTLTELGLGYRSMLEHLEKNREQDTENTRDDNTDHFNIFKNVKMIDAKSWSQLVSSITASEWQYAKRQIRWFKRDKRIRWFHPDDYHALEVVVQGFLEQTR